MRILYTNNEGGVSIVVPSNSWSGTMAELAAKIIPNVAHDVVAKSKIPTDRLFRNAWVKGNAKIETDMPKAKLLAHDMRRASRDEQFKPLDIKATIPSEAVQAEADRQVIRNADAVLQAQIDNAPNENALKGLLVAANVVAP